MSECETLELDSTVTLRFVGCKDHGHVRFTGGSASSGGVQPSDIVDGLLSYSEHLFMILLQEKSEVQALLNAHYKSPVGQHESPLDEEDKNTILSLMAHELLTLTVFHRDYPTNGNMAIMSVPMGGDQ